MGFALHQFSVNRGTCWMLSSCACLDLRFRVLSELEVNLSLRLFSCNGEKPRLVWFKGVLLAGYRAISVTPSVGGVTMESGKSSGSGFFHFFLGLCGFWFLACTCLHISGIFLRAASSPRLLVFASPYLWLMSRFGLPWYLLKVGYDLSAPGPIAIPLS